MFSSSAHDSRIWNLEYYSRSDPRVIYLWEDPVPLKRPGKEVPKGVVQDELDVSLSP
jgi:hypothetical protein